MHAMPTRRAAASGLSLAALVALLAVLCLSSTLLAATIGGLTIAAVVIDVLRHDQRSDAMSFDPTQNSHKGTKDTRHRHFWKPNNSAPCPLCHCVNPLSGTIANKLTVDLSRRS